MLNKHTQIALCLTTTLTITNTYSSEYIIKNASDENKEQIYEIVSKFRFPSILSKFTQAEFKQKYPNHDLVETFVTEAAEYDFKKQEINKIDKNARLWNIPKSLYQLIVYDYFATLIKEPFGQTYEKLKKLFKVEKYTQDNEEYGITKACDRLMQSKEIQDIFWEVNDHATQLYKQFSGDLVKITNQLLDNFLAKGDKNSTNSPTSIRPLDISNIKMSYNSSRITTLVGLQCKNYEIYEVETPKGWDEDKRKKLKEYVTNLILSEKEIPEYVIYRGDYYRGDSKQLEPKIAYRKSLCLSDGIFSGFIFDQGASAFAISGKFLQSKLYVLKLDRKKLLTDQYPIFIPPMNALASAAGSGELFHIRSKVIQAVKSGGNIDKQALSIQSCCGEIKAGYLPSQTPELFMNKNPQILEERMENYEFVYHATSQGEFDQDGAQKIDDMIANIKGVPADGRFFI